MEPLLDQHMIIVSGIKEFDYSVESQDKEESIIRQTMTGTIGEYLRLRLAVFRRS